MIEQVYRMDPGQRIQKVVCDGNLHYIHMLFAQGDGLPEHPANSTVYMTVVQGTLTITLDGQEATAYPAGSLLRIPRATHMQVRNLHPETLELIVVKAPAPEAAGA